MRQAFTASRKAEMKSKLKAMQSVKIMGSWYRGRHAEEEKKEDELVEEVEVDLRVKEREKWEEEDNEVY